MAELTLHNLRINKASKKKPKRLGRGNASGHGTYSGRGLKGQKSRSGGKGGLKRKGLANLLRNKPKIGGFRSPYPKMTVINLDLLEQNFKAGELVNPGILLAKNLVRKAKDRIKILGEGKLTKKLTVLAHSFSESAKKAIIEAGGKAEVISKSKR
jgi:large subunit ribosomal protein L15